MTEFITTALKVLNDVGVGAVFLVLFLAALWYMGRLIDRSRKDGREMLTMTITALEQNNATLKQQGEMLKQVVGAMAAEREKVGEFLAYLRGRDDAR